jgi:hypothetical protein
MDLRNIKRWFVINKALRTYNKGNSRPFKPSDIALLFSIAFASDHAQGATLEDLHKYLFSFNRGFRFDRLTDRINTFITLKLVKSQGIRPVRYSLTFEGSNVLNELELKCRDTRYDK